MYPEPEGECNRAIEVCGLVKVVEVSAGFKYKENSFRTWFILVLAMMGYASWAAAPYNNDNDMNTSWMFNFYWTSLTWGWQLFFAVNKILFKSEGGTWHKWFLRFVNFSVINYFLIYWLIDMVVLRGTLSYNPPVGESKGNDYAKLGALFVLQVISTVIQINYRASLDFDYNLANAEPQEFVESTWVPEDDNGFNAEIRQAQPSSTSFTPA